MHWFLDPIKNHYFDFKGRATRKEYWMFALFYLVIYILLSIVDYMIGMQILTFLFSLALLVPHIALAARRLHDTGKSGWWQVIVLVPFVGWVIAIVLLALKGHDTDNKYGPYPYGASSAVPTPAPAPMSEMRTDSEQ